MIFCLRTSSHRPRHWLSAKRASKSRRKALRIGWSRTAFRGEPSVETNLAERLTPETLGKLVALYEHSVFHARRNLEYRFVRPMGCRAGQVLAQRIIPELESREEAKLDHDSSTNSLIRRYRKYVADEAAPGRPIGSRVARSGRRSN